VCLRGLTPVHFSLECFVWWRELLEFLYIIVLYCKNGLIFVIGCFNRRRQFLSRLGGGPSLLSHFPPFSPPLCLPFKISCLVCESAVTHFLYLNRGKSQLNADDSNKKISH